MTVEVEYVRWIEPITDVDVQREQWARDMEFVLMTRPGVWAEIVFFPNGASAGEVVECLDLLAKRLGSHGEYKLGPNSEGPDTFKVRWVNGKQSSSS